MRTRLTTVPAVSALIVLGLSVLAVVGARSGAPVPLSPRRMPWDLPRAEPLHLPPPPVMPQMPPPGEPSPIATAVVNIVMSVVIVAVLALIVLVLVRALVLWLRSRPPRRAPKPVVVVPPGEPGVEPGGEHLPAAARAASVELSRRAGADPTDAIVAAWMALETGAAAGGSPRAAHQTPTEFTSAVLAAHGVDPDALAELRRRYQRARFGAAGAVTARDVVVAQEALRRIERSFAVPAGAPVVSDVTR